MNIPDEAVEVAARGLARHKWPTAIGVWDSFGQGMKDDFRDQARAALEAAAPHMMERALEAALAHTSEVTQKLQAEAWSDGCAEGLACDWDKGSAALPHNPYRTQEASTATIYGLLAHDDEYLDGSPNLAWIKSRQAETPGSQIVVKRDGVWSDYAEENELRG
jgi:hypothetical protein